MTKLDGVLLVNKPAGISSAQVVNRVKNLYGLRKVGHAGTLDPFATGLLVCCINRATRLTRFFLDGEKKYRGVLELGVETDTQDLTGNITKIKCFKKIQIKEIKRIFSRFKGRMYQTPPFFSALKQNGVPLYRLAREGIYVVKPPRSIFIHDLSISYINLPEVFFEIHCSSGTYVRTICADIGRALGCGGHLKVLQRFASSNFSINEAFGLDSLESNSKKQLYNFILPMIESLNFMPSYTAESSLVEKIRKGIKLGLFDFVDPENQNSIFTFNGVFFKVIDTQGGLVAILSGSSESVRYKYCCVF